MSRACAERFLFFEQVGVGSILAWDSGMGSMHVFDLLIIIMYEHDTQSIQVFAHSLKD